MKNQFKLDAANCEKCFLKNFLKSEGTLSEIEQDKIVDLLSTNMEAISRNNVESLVRLRNDIEIVNLVVLIERYEKMLFEANDESVWQNFFCENPFILSLAFGYPIVKVQDQASIGGRRISGKGETIADFLVKNSLTSNAAIVEIKKPSEQILGKSEYREGLYPPSRALSASINQSLDQKYNFEKQIAIIKENSGINDLVSYAVNCCLVIGIMPSEKEKQKSFELFRGNSKNVEIVTFDELLEKIKNLKEFLENPDNDRKIEPEEYDLPF